ncbi:alpha/beta hydrolase [Microbacteriaceae bacterium VKM Ac-2855]|nr:alpha/beta hydrolase [Microbacteriaceae bacterium VKM Ac-2855]
MLGRPLRGRALRRRAYLRDYRYAYAARLRHLRDGWDVEHFSTGSKAPVLLIPGIYETWQFLRPIAERLHDAGHPIHVLPALGYNAHPIEDSARMGQEYLRAADLRGVIIVAHSKGGLIGKHMMVVDDLQAGEDRIDRMIAVSTPFSGSSLSRIAPGRALREFHPRKRTIRFLRSERAVNSRITSIYGRRDQYIPRGSRLEGAAENVIVPVVGHFAILADPAVLDAVAERVG